MMSDMPYAAIESGLRNYFNHSGWSDDIFRYATDAVMDAIEAANFRVVHNTQVRSLAEQLAASPGRCPECGKNIGHFVECSQHET